MASPPTSSPAVRYTGTSAVGVAMLGLWFGLVTGVLDGAYGLFARHTRPHLDSLSHHVFWMAVVGDVLWLAVPTLVLLGYWVLAPRRRSLGVAVALLAFPSWAALVLLYPRLHPWAVLLLAAGLTVQTTRAALRWQGGFLRMVRLGTPVLAGAVVLVALVQVTMDRRQDRRAVARLGPRSDAPSLLLLTIDTGRWLDFGFSAPGHPTPVLEKLASNGVLFTYAFATAPWTLPSHAGMFTGRNHFDLSVGWTRRLGRADQTIAEALSNAGYATAGFVANLQYCGRSFGLDRGFVHYEDTGTGAGEFLLSTSLGRWAMGQAWVRRATGYYAVPGRKNAAEVNAEFVDWLGGVDNRPFFAFLNYYDAHEPYDAPDEFLRRFGALQGRHPELLTHLVHEAFRPDKEHMAAAEIAAEHGAYRAALAYIDREVGGLLEQLRQRGMLTRTILVITSDHGEQFGEHGLFDHGNSQYRQALQVPLLIVYPPDVPQGLRINAAVSLRDLPATIVDLTGATATFPGQSLARFWQGGSAAQEPVVSELRSPSGEPSWSVTTDSLRYLRGAGGREMLFRTADSVEAQDLMATEEGQARLPFLRRLAAGVIPGASSDQQKGTP